MSAASRAREHPLVKGAPPAWATTWGEDRCGVFAGFSAGEVDHVFRYIAPGTFWMGSPEGEEGRHDDEGPRHLVTLSRGFWLGEVPCTQALWSEVMGENPSRWKTPDRPVENVSFERVQAFLAALNARVAGLDVRLPSEAEWEYACRAGTETATYDGDLRILGQNNAPVLDAIAWYGGNSGVGFELADGSASSSWPEKQHDHARAGTHPVARKRANAWGLFDMLGNVYEWCADGQREYGTGAIRDPLGPTDEGAARVFRGGSWRDRARVVRAADRLWDDPSHAYDDLGFRLARGP